MKQYTFHMLAIIFLRNHVNVLQILFLASAPCTLKWQSWFFISINSARLFIEYFLGLLGGSDG